MEDEGRSPLNPQLLASKERIQQNCRTKDVINLLNFLAVTSEIVLFMSHLFSFLSQILFLLWNIDCGYSLEPPHSLRRF